ncbi:hypothetical protein Hanom_Chr06g00482111 [Helianthus anomalus]
MLLEINETRKGRRKKVNLLPPLLHTWLQLATHHYGTLAPNKGKLTYMYYRHYTHHKPYNYVHQTTNVKYSYLTT